MSAENKKILVTGGYGFVGKHLVEELAKTDDIKTREILVPKRAEFDLRLREDCERVVRDIDIVIHLAANVGGIGYNLENPGALFFDNITMGVHMIDESYKSMVEKFVAVGTVCAYPKHTPVPFREENLWDGYPEETNAPYGLAKKMLLVMLQAYRKQYGFNGIYLLPVNLYGPGDNFDPKSSHVIPALIRKFHQARISNLPEVLLWGTGKATREFLYVKDAAKGIVLAMEHYEKPDPVNLGVSFEISIDELAGKIAKILRYSGRIRYDPTKPDGQPRRKLDTSRAEVEFGFKSKTPFDEGLAETIEWYEKSFESAEV